MLNTHCDLQIMLCAGLDCVYSASKRGSALKEVICFDCVGALLCTISFTPKRNHAEKSRRISIEKNIRNQ